MAQKGKKRTPSSRAWLARQERDPWVKAARQQGYRSRAAFKLLHLHTTFDLIRSGMRVVDLGAAPGGWSQVAAALVGKAGTVVALDRLPMVPLSGVTLLEADFLDERAPQDVREALGGAADVVLSDLAPNTTGHTATDHLRIVALVDAAFAFACATLNEGGTFVAKVFQGGTTQELLVPMQRCFRRVRHAKPPASRAESAETYVVAQDFRASC